MIWFSKSYVTRARLWFELTASLIPLPVTAYGAEATGSEGDLSRCAYRSFPFQYRISRFVHEWDQLSPAKQLTRSLSYLGIIGSSVQCQWNIQKKCHWTEDISYSNPSTWKPFFFIFWANVHPAPLEKKKCSYCHNLDTVKTITSLSIYPNLACNTSFL